MSTNQMTNFVIDQPRMINGKEYLVTTVNGFDRVQINTKLHDIGEVILNLKMEQDRLVQMRNLIDRQHEETDDLFNELFGDTPLAEEVCGGWLTATSTLRLTSKRAIFVFKYQTTKMTNYIKIPDFVFENIIHNLQRSYDVCDNVDYSSDETDKSPYYATGYSRATIRDVIEQLNQYKVVGN